MTLIPGFERRRRISKQIASLIRKREEHRGLLIAFEGPDGSGKTTQRKLFKQWLHSEGHQVTTTKWNSSALIKPVTKARKQVRALSAEEFCLLHASDFRYRMDSEILPALWDGTTVVADRYLFTALARDAARGLELDWLLKVYSPLFWPDLVFYFSVTPETSSQRIAADRDPSYYEAGQDITQIENPLQSYRTFITRVIAEYEALAGIFKFVTIDAEQSVYDQHRLIRSIFEKVERRSWAEWNQEALVDWLVQHPRLAV
ncbi:MAG: dTMP kinase [Acidobacteria bacterium]|nr:dTMP kinase [Acidobacteriota bacterium]